MGGCVTKYTELDLSADSFSDTLLPDQVKFYGITIKQVWLEKKLDLVIRVHVEKGRLQGVYCARDRPMPNQRRKMWSNERYCACPNPTCDHCYPYCLNELGGICLECMVHDEKWDRISHELNLGGMPTSATDNSASAPVSELQGFGMALESSETVEPPYQDQTDYEFSLRLVPSVEKHLLSPGHFFLSIKAAPEVVSRALRQQRRLEGEEEYHTTKYSLWIEERVPKTAPQVGNELRVAEAEERLKRRQERAQKKAEFGKKFDAGLEQEKRELEDAQKLKEIGIHLGDSEEKTNTRISLEETKE